MPMSMVLPVNRNPRYCHVFFRVQASASLNNLNGLKDIKAYCASYFFDELVAGDGYPSFDRP
jgi:hypothetical protein